MAINAGLFFKWWRLWYQSPESELGPLFISGCQSERIGMLKVNWPSPNLMTVTSEWEDEVQRKKEEDVLQNIVGPSG